MHLFKILSKNGKKRRSKGKSNILYGVIKVVGARIEILLNVGPSLESWTWTYTWLVTFSHTGLGSALNRQAGAVPHVQPKHFGAMRRIQHISVLCFIQLNREKLCSKKLYFARKSLRHVHSINQSPTLNVRHYSSSGIRPWYNKNCTLSDKTREEPYLELLSEV